MSQAHCTQRPKVDVLILKSTGLVEGVELNEEEVKVGSPEMCKEVLQLRRGRKELKMWRRACSI